MLDSSPWGVCRIHAMPFAPRCWQNSMYLSRSLRENSWLTVMHLTVPPFAMVSLKMEKCDFLSMCETSTSVRSKRRSGLSEPYVFMASW